MASATLPRTSLLRLYDEETRGNSFSLDGFPVPGPGPEGGPSQDWFCRLERLIRAQGILGMTTNQTLFRALVEAGTLDTRLAELKAEGRSAAECYRLFYNEAAVRAAGAFAAAHARWPWEGRVSQEASALLTDLDPLVGEVRRIAKAMDGVGAFTKIPNLKIGPRAIAEALRGPEVVHPNVTLVFSDRHYVETVAGTLEGLERLGEQAARIHSVNSLFVSRVDRVADPMILRRAQDDRLQEEDRQRLRLLKGKVAVAQGKVVYRIFRAVFLDEPFEDPEGLYADEEGRALTARIADLAARYRKLRARGVNPQRLLIASTGVKSDQPYSPLLYVLPFLGPWVTSTLPEKTLEILSRFVEALDDEQTEALRRRCLIREPLPAVPTDITPSSRWDALLLMSEAERRAEGVGSLSPDRILADADRLVFKPAGTDLRTLCDGLRDRGAAAFTADEQATLAVLEKKLASL